MLGLRKPIERYDILRRISHIRNVKNSEKMI